MTEDDIKQMIADREAGTPGSWKVGNRYIANGVFSEDEDTTIANTHGQQQNFNREQQIAEQNANARRIARVPDLEAEVLRLREALKIIAGYSQCIDNLMGNVDVAREALEGKRNDRYTSDH